MRVTTRTQDLDINLDDLADLTPIEIPFKYRGGDYVLREGNGDVAARYQNKMLSCIKSTDGKGVSSAQGLGDVDAFLLSLCVSKADGGGISEATIRSWDNRVVKRLYKVAKQISELDADDSIETLKKQRAELDKQIKQKEEDALGNE